MPDATHSLMGKGEQQLLGAGSELSSRERLLYVTFMLEGNVCALDACRIERIVPVLPLRQIPGVTESVLGVFEYHGEVVPVVDLSQAVLGQASRRVMSTRIILTRLTNGRLLGLLAEEVTETVELRRGWIKASGVKSAGAPFLGDMFEHPDGRLVQCVDPEKVLPPAVLDALNIDTEDRGERSEGL